MATGWPADADLAHAFEVVRGSSINREHVVAADDFLAGSLMLGRHGTRDITDGVDWVGEGESNSIMRLVHGQFIVNDLVAAYNESGDERYLDAAYDHVRSWQAANPFEAPASPMAWHDETTARRLMNWLVLLDASDGYSDREAVDDLWQAARDHAALLRTPEFHATGTNHGMFQDQALLAYSVVVPDREEALATLDIARRRLLAYFDSVVGDDGVHLEHSPAYHQIIASAMRRYRDFFVATGDKETARLLEKTFDSMARYATFVIQPDGTLPMVGDTFANARPRKGLFQDDGYRYASTAGVEGVMPAGTAAVFPDAGYAIFRDRWVANGDGIGTYLHFTAAYHGSYHKHSDELSVWLYHDGDLLTESGPNGYTYDDPITAYAYSSEAHNTLLVDGEGLPRDDGNFDGTYLESYDLDGAAPSATGVTTRYEGIRWARTVSLQPDPLETVVTDQIDTSTVHDFTLLWHVAPGVDATMTDDGAVELSREGSIVARLTVESDDVPATVSVASDDPDSIRSLRLGGGDPIPTQVITIDFRSDRPVTLTTTVDLFR